MDKFFKNYGFYFLFLIFGILIFFFPMFKSGFDLMPGDGVNEKLYGYILEHSYLWLKQDVAHKYLWSPPIYYPNSNALALNDVLIGIMPLYWGLRAFIDNPFSAFQGLYIILCFLNFSSFYYLLNRQLKFSSLSSSFGAFIFAFNLMRIFRISEIGYLTQFFTIFAIIFLLKVNKNNTPLKNHLWFLLFALSMIVQFYTSFSLAFFAFLAGFTALMLAFLPKTGRDFLVEFFSNFYKLFLFYTGIIILMLIPLSYHYISAGVIQTYKELLNDISNFYVWIRNTSILDSLFFKNLYYIGPLRSSESSCAAGIFTTIAAFFGLWKIKYSKGVPILLLIFIFLISCNISAIILWKALYFILPGAEILQSVSRISFIALIVFAFGIAVLIQYLQENTLKNKIFTKTILVLTILLLAFEQISLVKDKNSAWKNYTWSKAAFKNNIEKALSAVSDECKVIEFQYHPYNVEKYGKLDAYNKTIETKKRENVFGMWLALEKGTITTNSLNEAKRPYVIDKCKIIKPLDFDEL